MNKFPAIRQNASSAALVVEQLGHMTTSSLKELISTYFSTEEEQNGKLSLEFLQGFYSGLNFAQARLARSLGPSSTSTQLITEVAIEAARKYNEEVEKQASKSV